MKTRANCRCPCHRNPRVKHIVACCTLLGEDALALRAKVEEVLREVIAQPLHAVSAPPSEDEPCP